MVPIRASSRVFVGCGDTAPERNRNECLDGDYREIYLTIYLQTLWQGSFQCIVITVAADSGSFGAPALASTSWEARTGVVLAPLEAGLRVPWVWGAEPSWQDGDWPPGICGWFFSRSSRNGRVTGMSS